MASLELRVPITPSHGFPAASISKQLTAMSILLLVQRGQLSLDDDQAKHIPEWVDHRARITIRNLLNHMSGLRDAFLLQGLSPPREDGSDPNEAILQVLMRARGLNFLPGSEFQYNNGAYNLLGTIVKRVSGKSLREFAYANIFQPLGRALLQAMQTPAIATGWAAGSAYGFGVEVAKYRGLRTMGHGGGDRGISSYVVRYPDQEFAVALLCNLDNIGEGGGATRLSQEVADIYLSDVLGPPQSRSVDQIPPVPLSTEQLASKLGLYRDMSDDSVAGSSCAIANCGRVRVLARSRVSS